MNELTVALDDLESAVVRDGTGSLYRNARPQLIHVAETLRASGGDLARLAVLIEELTARGTNYISEPGISFRPGGRMTTPGSRSDVTTVTAGNGVMSGAGN